MSPGLEPPRADGVILSRLDMKSFTEMGKPHIQFELTGRSPLAPAITSESGSPAMAIALGKAAPAATRDGGLRGAARYRPSPDAAAPAKAPEPAPAEPAVKVEDVPASASGARSASARSARRRRRCRPPRTDAPPVPVRHAAAGRPATRLSGVSVRVSDGKLVATLAGNGSFTYETFALENPPRYVVDLPGVLLAMPKRAQDVKHAAVSRVRVSQFKAGTEPVTRVVFDLASPSEPAAKASPSALALVFGSAPEPAPGGRAAPASRRRRALRLP